MNDNKASRPTILIDQKKHRIRIHKHTLHMLGDPRFIQLMVNPESLTVALRAGEGVNSISHRIVWKNFISKQSYELYSRFLIQELQSVCTNWKSDESYKIPGEFIPSEGIIRFDLRDVQPCLHIWEA